MDLNKMQNEFDKAISLTIDAKRDDNKSFMNNEEYDRRIEVDHLTKFVILKPLKTKRAEEIAYNLMEMYTPFGAPAILHSDNGREFVISVINELHSVWGDVNKWFTENQDIVRGLKFIQFRKNRAFHSGIGRSPYEAMFGCPARLGVASIGLPVDEISSLKSEEDIECILKSNKDEGAEENVPCTSNLEQVTSDQNLLINENKIYLMHVNHLGTI
ncbi:KRAB-A domain-containing protein 2-like [Acyrthosiphon pisum]|uniref:Integrase catalytic domain-containing protein n=1 Tax=Acyrthosiphon pisum TaxID=7029 RepID=A0A8R2F9N5_ACYPI|nr:KRAB-A domain-containing protein 2-like [Acyrthosiphon pisum]|eukprot:XP_008185120.1 PREDICTED: KRAB-A domain-containing protein 2-like [Acyrthosiphon pisum]